MNIELTDKEFRRLLDLVYIGNWILNSTREKDRFEDYDILQEKLFAQCAKNGMNALISRWQGHIFPSPAYENGGNMQARADMLRAAYCAGVSFTRSYVGYVHGVAHSLGGQYGVPHGLANAVILPYFLDAYGAACHQKLGRLARIAHVAPESASDREAAEAFIRWIREMNARMGIPEKIPQIRTVDIPEMARHAARESNPLYPVPVLMDERRLAQMYVQLMPVKKEENA